MNPEIAELTKFLGFDLYGWLKEIPASRLVALFNTLLEAKLINYKMIRTLTNLADITPAIRNAMQPMQRTALLDVVGVEYKPTREGLIWTYAVAYVFIRNVCKYMRQHPKGAMKHPCLARLYEHDAQNLEEKYASGTIFKHAMKELQAFPRYAYRVYTAFDKLSLACAMRILDNDEIVSLLRNVATRAFTDDIIQLAKGSLSVKDKYSVFTSQSKFVDSVFSGKPMLIDRQKVMALLRSLDDEHYSRCLFNANLLDFGMYLRNNKTEIAGDLFASLTARLAGVPNYIVMATYEKRFNINYDEAVFFCNLASQIFQDSVARGTYSNLSDFFTAIE